ncbi:YXWGXW repeat-containing protein [Granulicella sibirica]|uniref:Single-stranded DNA-binding protein n=1 Tax=Granulicella sibirica TaxID=2479048 RepID=A0A4V1L597_9BACT|nr:YXWGXW repeat-containing protein [Granulicella sibirica]RXH55004.1 Single-stranded DNA-binding protein [Granulicella sibirica]
MKNITNLVKRTLGAAVLAAALIAPAAAHARIFLSVGIAPPVIPVYEQPLCPGDGYIWTPGYWAYGDDGYFWVDGAWVEAPYENALWTPGYWGYDNNAYVWNAGYWGPTVGYYGGINYGFGYFGAGFYGGYWNSGRFFYNRGYNHLDFNRIHNVYNTPYRGGNDHPGGRAFDDHPGAGRGFAGNRGAAVNGREFDRGNFQNRVAQPNRDNGNFQNRVAQPSNNGGNFQNRTAQQNGFGQGGDQGGNQNVNRPAYGGGDSTQRGFAVQNGYQRPATPQNFGEQNNGRQQGGQQSFGQRQGGYPQPSGQQNYSRPTQSQPAQNYSRPASSPAPQAQPQTRSFSAPSAQSAPSGGGSRGGEGGGHGGGGGYRR